MWRIIVATLLVASCVQPTVAQQPEPKDVLPPAPQGKPWKLIWHDEFDGTKLDETKWRAEGEGPRRDGWWSREAASPDGKGHLVIETRKQGDRYIDACITTRGKFEHRFGFYVTRIQFQKQHGHWPGFWLTGPGVHEGGNEGRDGTEIDIMEKPNLDDRVEHNLHWNGYGDAHKQANKVVNVPGIMEGFHTFGLWWKPDEYIFYVDGKETWRTRAGGVCQAPEYILLSDEIANWLGDIRTAKLPDRVLFDYVRVYDVPGGMPAVAAPPPPPPPLERRAEERAKAIRGSLIAYAGEPRGKDGRVDIPRLLSELVETHANTYHWLIWHAPTDWDDLQRFLPLAREKRIRVWVCLAPPTESPPHPKTTFSEPFRLNFERWAAEIARLSVREPNLVAWTIDDFTDNLATGSFGVERMRRIIRDARRINPKLAFVPCGYYNDTVSRLVKDYRGLFDGLVLPYLHESGGRNLTDPSLVAAEVKKLRELLGPYVPVIVNVYATAHSQYGGTTPDYVRQVMTSAHQCADGVQVFCHQDPTREPEKYRLIKELFTQWSGK